MKKKPSSEFIQGNKKIKELVKDLKTRDDVIEKLTEENNLLRMKNEEMKEWKLKYEMLVQDLKDNGRWKP